MTTSITSFFQNEYQKDVQHVFQRKGSYVKSTVRTKDNVIGSTTTFNVAGKGTASTKSRHGQVPPMNSSRTQQTCTLSDYYAGDWYDDLDSAKHETDEAMTIATTGAMVLGRKVDELIILALDGTSNSGTSWTLTNAQTIENSALAMVEALWALDVPNDGQNYGLITARCFSQLSKVPSFARADWTGSDGLPFKAGAPVGLAKFKDWMGVKWQVHIGLTESFTGTAAATRKIYVYNKTAVGFAMAKHAKNIASNPGVKASMQYYNTHEAWFVNHLFSAGAVLIDDSGVIEQTFNDSTALVTA